MPRKSNQLKHLIPISKKGKRVANPWEANAWWFLKSNVVASYKKKQDWYLTNKKHYSKVDLTSNPALNKMLAKNKDKSINRNKFFIINRNKGKSSNLVLKELVACNKEE